MARTQDPGPAGAGLPSTTESAVEASGVAKSFGRNEVLRGLDLTVEWGETIAVLGSNGSGKSTLIRLLAGLSKADSGEIRIAGLDPGAVRREGTARCGSDDPRAACSTTI